MFVAEIGINHNGNLDIAKELILVAKRCGVNIVKFQKRNIDENILPKDKNTTRQTLSGIKSYEQYKKDLEFNYNDYLEIDKFCNEIGIKWTASVWDISSVEFITQFDVPFIKIPSARINELELLKAVNATKKPVIISTGMSSEYEIDLAVKTLENLQAIMYCKSIYPPADEDLNLNGIQLLQEKYPNIQIGYSSHDASIYPIICASALGAELFELHITLNRNMYGSDQKCSFEEKELKEIVETTNKTKVWLGDKEIHCLPNEIPFKDKLRRPTIIHI